MGATTPPPVSFSVTERLIRDLRAERAAEAPMPPGRLDFSMRRTRAFVRNPLPELLSAYADFGPIFTLRILHAPVVFMLGPEANHHITVSHAEDFTWREGSLGDLIPLLGDGLLTIDGAYHRQARRIMLPAFHRERIAAAATTMLEEIDHATAAWAPGDRFDVYRWTRELALRIAMRALFGIDPDSGAQGVDAAGEFEHALGYYGRDYLLQILRGPGSPWRRMHAARRRLDAVIHGEIARRRGSGESGGDILSLLIESRDEDGRRLSDCELRDQVMTLMFAGHDTTTSTVSFLLYELSRNPSARAAVLEEQDRVLGGEPPTAAQLTAGMPELEQAVDETLRLYPPAWVGPRRAVKTFEFAGTTVPAGAAVNYSSWASHHLPDVWEDPEAFRPQRFAPEARAALPRGAYVPFGGGSRTCIGMRFGLLEVRAIATRVLQRFRVDPEPGWQMSVRQMPTLSPRGGMPVVLSRR